MKILVCISKTPDTTSKIAFKDAQTKLEESGVQWIINPYDEWYALTKAIELKEQDASIEIHLITVGLADCDALIRKAFALGGDEAIRVNAESDDSYYIATQIASVAEKGNYDLIFTGKETIDYNSCAVGAMIAASLDYHYVGMASSFEWKDTHAHLTREVEGAIETVEVSLPLVVSCSKGMAAQRIPNMRGIMAARTKPLKVVESIAIESGTTLVTHELMPTKMGVRLIDAENVVELARIFHEELHII